MSPSEQNGSRSDHWSHFPSRLDRYLASFKPYLLLVLMHMSLLLLNYFELSFLTSISFFPIWCAQYITWYARYIISNVTFTFWKTWYYDFKCVVPGISHEKRSLTKNFFNRLPVSMLHHRNSSILGMPHLCSSEILCFRAVTIFQICYGLVNRLTKG